MRAPCQMLMQTLDETEGRRPALAGCHPTCTFTLSLMARIPNEKVPPAPPPLPGV